MACPECEKLREEIADYMGHRTDNVAGKLWAAQAQFGWFEEQLYDLLGEPPHMHLGSDDYDQSLEIYGVPEDLRLNEKAQRFIQKAGFAQVYVNHERERGEEDAGKWETYYRLGDPTALPVKGWRRRYVSDPTVKTTRVIAGPVENGYWEISEWPESWGDKDKSEDLKTGYYRIVPDKEEK